MLTFEQNSSQWKWIGGTYPVIKQFYMYSISSRDGLLTKGRLFLPIAVSYQQFIVIRRGERDYIYSQPRIRLRSKERTFSFFKGPILVLENQREVLCMSYLYFPN
jgi:hypothetical protein